MTEPCYTCRRRRIQCDQSGTPCGKCKKAGIDCLKERPLRWVRGVAIRGGMRGRSYNESSTPITSPTNSATGALHIQGNGENCGNNGFLGSPTGLGDPALLRLAPVARFYLDYYDQQICKLFIVYDSQRNPFRTLISIALNNSMLLDAVLSLATRHRANFNRSFADNRQPTGSELASVDHDAMHFKYRAIQSLSRAVNCPKLRMADETIATVFLLIFLDLLESGCDRWNKHIEGAKSLMALMGPEDPGRMVQQIRRFITKEVYLIETLGAALVRPRLITGFTSPAELTMPDEDIVEESFLGCPAYLLKAVRYISLQRDSLTGTSPTTHPFPLEQLQGLTATLESVKNFNGQLWAARLSSSPNTSGLYALFRSYQLATLLFGHRVHDTLKNESTPQDALVLELLSVAASIKDDYPNLLKCALWPIFIAGLECRQPTERNFVMSALERFYEDTRCINVANAAEILRNYWMEHDQPEAAPSEWVFGISHLRHDWLLV